MDNPTPPAPSTTPTPDEALAAAHKANFATMRGSGKAKKTHMCEWRRHIKWINENPVKCPPSETYLQLFHQMGPDPVPETHRGVELIIRSLARWMQTCTSLCQAMIACG